MSLPSQVFTTLSTMNAAIRFANGNVGIGTTSPSQRLHVVGNTDVGGSVRATGFNAFSSGAGVEMYYSGGGGIIHAYDRSTSAFKTLGINSSSLFLNADTAGRVGVGTASPGFTFDITSTAADDSFRIQNTNANGYASMRFRNNAANNDFVMGVAGTGGSVGAAIRNKFYFYGAASDRMLMIVNTAGNIGINNTNPGTALHIGTGDVDSNVRNTVSLFVPYRDIESRWMYLGWGSGTEARISTDQAGKPMTFCANDTERMRITDAGNVGIGTNSPQVKLDVAGDIGIPYNNAIRVNAGSSFLTTKMIETGWAINGLGGDCVSIYTPGTASATPRINISSSGVINLNGNVGIGTATPGYTLDVSGTSQVFSSALGSTVGNTTNSFRVGWSNVNGSYLDILGYRTSNGSDWTTASTRIQQTIDVTKQAYIEFNGTNKTGSVGMYGSNDSGLMVDSGGNVGIGTASPSDKLHLYTSTASANIGTITQNGSRQWRAGIRGDTNNNYVIQDDTASAMRMVIDTSGNVGIGTGSPAYKLDVNGKGRVNGNLMIASAGDNNLGINFPTAGYGLSWGLGYSRIYDDSDLRICTDDTMHFYTGSTTSSPGTEIMTLLSNGNMGVGTNSPSERLHVNGNVYAPGVKRVLTIDFSAQSNTTFYPVVFDTDTSTWADTHYIDVDMPSQGGGVAYTMHSMEAVVRGGGWSDQNAKYNVFHNLYDTAKRSILGIYRGEGDFYGVVVYLRGGKTYRITTASRSVTAYTTAVSVVTPPLGTTFQSTFALKNSSFADVSGTSSNISLLVDTMTTQAGRYQSDNFFVDGNVGIGTKSPAYKLDVNGEVIADGWFRTRGNRGWYNETYGGGWYMEDSAWIRNVGTKSVWVDGVNSILATKGKIGIGLSGPTQMLHLQKSGSDNYIKVDAGGTDAYWSGIMLTEYGINWGWSLRHSAATDLLHISYQDTTPTFTNTVTFNRSGNVGIGTESPQLPLHVVSSSDPVRFENTLSSGASFIQLKNDSRTWYCGPGGSSSGWADKFLIGPSGTESEGFIVTNTGSVGVGTKSPSSKLHVAGSFRAGDNLKINTDGDPYSYLGSSLVTSDTGDARFNIQDRASNCISFYAGTTKQGGITAAGGKLGINSGTLVFNASAGNVGIGTESPSSKLDVNGGLRVASSSSVSSQGVHIQWNRTGGDGESWILNQIGGGSVGGIRFGSVTTSDVTTERMRLTNGGQLNIGRDIVTANSYTLAIQDTADKFVGFYIGSSLSQGQIVNNYIGGVSYLTNSDYRVKENIRDFERLDGQTSTTPSLDILTQIPVRTFRLKRRDEGPAYPEVHGFIAHELQEYVPYAVHGQKDAVDANGNPDLQGVDAKYLVPSLVKAVQELKNMNDTLLQRIERLEAALNTN